MPSSNHCCPAIVSDANYKIQCPILNLCVNRIFTIGKIMRIACIILYMRPHPLEYTGSLPLSPIRTGERRINSCFGDDQRTLAVVYTFLLCFDILCGLSKSFSDDGMVGLAVGMGPILPSLLVKE